MSTDSPTSSQDVTTEGANNSVQAPSAEVIDNTPDNPETSSDDLHQTSQDDTPEEITGSLPCDDSMKDEEFKNQEKLDSSSQASPDEVVLAQDDLANVSGINFSDPQLFEKAIKKFKVESERLFEKNAQLDLKMDKILQENTRFHLDLTKENEQLHLEITSLNERLAKLEESAKFKFDGLIQAALKQDDLVWDEDSEECQKYIAQAKLWHSKTEELCTSVLTAISDCGDRINQCSELMEEINKESPSLYNSLQDRYKSLELSKRMLERLREPIELLKKSTLPSEQLLRLQAQDLMDLLRSQTDENEAKKILAKKVKETGDTRYKAIREWRDLAEKSQKQWLNFIEKKLLPALDGINDGKPHALDLVAELMNRYKIQSSQEKLSSWLQTYKDLEDILLDALKSLDVTQMLVVCGQPVDYDRHEPIGTEEDPNLPHESIKEITRNGYEYKLTDQSLILRSSQVLVVKNK